ncbi:serine/threonine protein kinase [Ktedonosporobacter rubrisoli]|uniref:non-specific serine/threonine protein kinase n=1 Tax=Ktedonosporobacter rubrisoli TaxID=2509675 RepID=A0A4P6JUH3_KTERU|nr:serine/threonine-protein kinase [Ktedonosporobacter rubrisoli]QBD79289.1 serine/threonine protein kinase [Ktedonosporobacter rubrisoli]
MNAEALIGTTLGTCTLQKLIGQGGMGAVFLAQQSRPRRQVAVKVLLPMTSLTSNQHAAFLERFRRETDAAASLEHPNIMPVHEYGEREGLAYLVMPYISGGTLRDELEREGALTLPKAMHYLDQIVAALGHAHERGVIHRDIKPANILMTPEGRLLLTDFGLVKIVAEGETPMSRLTGIGVPMGTPDYMAPEQVIGAETDARADLYSLGVILYQMVTGTVPFKGTMPMQIAMQHLHVQPPAPRTLRPDLPVAAEQVLLRVLSKRPVERYAKAQELGSAFHVALAAAGVQLGDLQGGLSGLSNPRSADGRGFKPRGLFDPVWQAQKAAAEAQGGLSPATGAMPAARPKAAESAFRNDIIAKTSMTLPSFTGFLSPSDLPMPAASEAPQYGQAPTASPIEPSLQADAVKNTPLPAVPQGGMGLGLRARLQAAQEQQVEIPSTPPQLDFPVAEASPAQAQQPMASATEVTDQEKTFKADQPAAPQPPPFAPINATNAPNFNNVPPGATGVMLALNKGEGEKGATGTLVALTGNLGGGNTGMMKLTQPMKVVKVPVAGQPGQYVTGLLPVLPEQPATETEEKKAGDSQPEAPYKNKKALLLIVAALLVVFGSGSFLFLRNLPGRQVNPALTAATPDVSATATLRALATVQANTILSDTLEQNAHNWPTTSKNNQTYTFKDGAYHITNNDAHAAIALLPDETLSGSFIYSLDVAEIKGDDNSVDNQFGLVINYTSKQKDGRTAATFYFFDVANTKDGGEYQFWKYDDSFGSDVNPWAKLWSQKLGKEYHFGHGKANTNTFKLAVNGSNFTFFMNGKQISKAQESSLKKGQIGMLVNLKGTEVAFSNLLVTYK